MTTDIIGQPEFDCMTCGACCRYAGHVLLTPTEPVPGAMTTAAIDVVGLDPDEAGGLLRMRRTSENQCVALQGELGHACSCGIYEVRPNRCREFTAGSLPCRGCRSAIGL